MSVTVPTGSLTTPSTVPTGSVSTSSTVPVTVPTAPSTVSVAVPTVSVSVPPDDFPVPPVVAGAGVGAVLVAASEGATSPERSVEVDPAGSGADPSSSPGPRVAGALEEAPAAVGEASVAWGVGDESGRRDVAARSAAALSTAGPSPARPAAPDRSGAPWDTARSATMPVGGCGRASSTTIPPVTAPVASAPAPTTRATVAAGTDPVATSGRSASQATSPWARRSRGAPTATIARTTIGSNWLPENFTSSASAAARETGRL